MTKNKKNKFTPPNQDKGLARNLKAKQDFVKKGTTTTTGLQSGGQPNEKMQGLLAAQNRIAKGTANELDKTNVAYAQKTGLLTGQTKQPFAVPTGMEKISGAQYPTGEAQKAEINQAVYGNVNPKFNTIQGTTTTTGLQSGGQPNEKMQGLLVAQNRIAKGTANELDKTNVAYAQKTGLLTGQTEQPFAVPTRKENKFTPPNQDEGLARNLKAEQDFVKNWGGKGGRLPTAAEINQAVYGNVNPKFNTIQGTTTTTGLQSGGQPDEKMQGLLAAQDRIAKGTANELDKTNVAYAQKTGLLTGQTEQPFAVPTGMEKISGAQYPTGEAQKAVYSDIQRDPTGTFLYGKKIAKDETLKAGGTTTAGATTTAGTGTANAGTAKTTGNLLSSSSVADTRQEVLNKMDELAGTIKTAKEEANKTYGLETKSSAITDIKTQLANKTAEWDKRLADNRSATVDMRVIEGNEAELLRMKSLDLLPLTQMVAIKQGDYERAEQLAKDTADDLYKAKELELDKLKTQLGFLSEDEKLKYDKAKEKLAEEKTLATNGYVKLSGPSQLQGLTANDIIHIPQANGVDDIYKKPIADKDYTTSFQTAGGKNLMITYGKEGNIIKQIDLGGAYKGTTGGGGGGGGGGTTVNEKQATQDMITQLSTVAGSDGYVSPDDYSTARNAWTSAGLNPTTFDTKMAGFKNPNNPYYTTSKQKEQPKTNIQLLEENKTKGIIREQVKTAGFSDEEINQVYGEEEPWWKFW